MHRKQLKIVSNRPKTNKMKMTELEKYIRNEFKKGIKRDYNRMIKLFGWKGTGEKNKNSNTP